jgi:hypothetical protein
MRGTLHGIMRAAGVSIRYPVLPSAEAWVLPDGPVPESIPHDEAAEHIKLVLVAWAARSPRELRIARNLAIRWIEELPRTGIDPDVCVLEPPPLGADTLGSLSTWLEGHEPPRLCFEIVSPGHPHKDYVAIQDRYAALGTRELVVFDPLLAGPRSLGGPVALQLWRRDPVGVLERVHFGSEPAFSTVLDAWLCPRGPLLEIADDRAGVRRWPTPEQAESRRAEAESRRAEAERARADREEAEREALALRVAELEEKLGT